MFQLTNATKAGIIAAINATIVLLATFGVPISQGELQAVLGFANAAMGLYVLLTYKDSPKRTPDEPPAA